MNRSTAGRVILCGFAVAVTACSSSGPPATAPASHAPSAAPAASPSPAAVRTYAPVAPMAAAGTVTDGSGDKADVDIWLGQPQPLTTLTQSQVAQCGPTSVYAYEPDRAVAIPVEIDAEITSALASPFGVQLNTDYLNNPDGSASDGNPPVWAQSSDTSGPACDPSGGGAALWNDLAPGVSSTWSGWMVVQAAITPDDPTGAQVVNGLVLERPIVTFGTDDGTWRPRGKLSHNLVQCPISMPATMIAVSPKGALARGCSR